MIILPLLLLLLLLLLQCCSPYSSSCSCSSSCCSSSFSSSSSSYPHHPRHHALNIAGDTRSRLSMCRFVSSRSYQGAAQQMGGPRKLRVSRDDPNGIVDGCHHSPDHPVVSVFLSGSGSVISRNRRTVVAAAMRLPGALSGALLPFLRVVGENCGGRSTRGCGPSSLLGVDDGLSKALLCPYCRREGSAMEAPPCGLGDSSERRMPHTRGQQSLWHLVCCLSRSSKQQGRRLESCEASWR